MVLGCLAEGKGGGDGEVVRGKGRLCGREIKTSGAAPPTIFFFCEGEEKVMFFRVFCGIGFFVYSLYFAKLPPPFLCVEDQYL